MSGEDSKGLGPLRRALRAGEWACVDAKCAYINGEKRHTCEICGKNKSRAKNRVGREIGKDAAEKSKGLFSADDWVCTKCGNVNWARRSVCNICNAPKLADLEVRTGYGGGYMDRQDVEYIERNDIDEEFDEFGRKKKKKNIENNDDVEIDLKKEKKVLEENENVEEEEDSDDADLGKYDFFADPELIALKVEPSKLIANSMNVKENNLESTISSDCSCSCSGGECSCIESDEEIYSKKSKTKKDDEKKQTDERFKSKSSHKESRSDTKDNDRRRSDDARDRSSEKSRDRSDKSERDRDRYYRSRR